MLAILITVIITFFVGSLFGYVVHYSLHQSWMGRFNDAHMTHHLKLYPPSDYVSDKYRNAGKDNTVIIFGLAAVPIFAVPVVLGILHMLPLTLVITSLIVMSIMSLLHSYLHDSFHIRNHWLHRVPGIGKLFSHWVHIHWLHHVDMDTNYGIFIFFLDRLFGTYWSD